MSSNLLIKTNDDDWIEVYINGGECIWRDHHGPMWAHQLQDFLNTLGITSEIEITEDFD